MRFITVRDLRTRPAQVWRELEEAGELVVTSNGRPIAILSSAPSEGVEETLTAIRRARAVAAVDRLQRRSVRRGDHRITARDVNAEIAAARRGR